MEGRGRDRQRGDSNVACHQGVGLEFEHWCQHGGLLAPSSLLYLLLYLR
jgi:hypothetical protein